MTESAIRRSERKKIVAMLDKMEDPTGAGKNDDSGWADGLEAATCRVLQCDIKSGPSKK